MIRRFSQLLIKNDNLPTTTSGELSSLSISPTTPTTKIIDHHQNTNTKKSTTTPSSPVCETTSWESKWNSLKRVSSATTPLSPITNASSESFVKKVVSNRKNLFLSHVKQKKSKMDKREKSLQRGNSRLVSPNTTCEVIHNNDRKSTVSLEQWNSFHSKQGLYSYFYVPGTEEDMELKEPPKIISRRKICA